MAKANFQQAAEESAWDRQRTIDHMHKMMQEEAHRQQMMAQLGPQIFGGLKNGGKY